METSIISKQLIEQIAELAEEERLRLLHFVGFLKYDRERMEDAAFAKYIEAGLDDEFLTVTEAVQYLETFDDVADSD